MKTPERSVEEIVEEFKENYVSAIDDELEYGFVECNAKHIVDWLTQTLKAERQKREEVVEAVKKQEAQLIMEWLYNRELPIPLYIVERLGGLTQPNNK